jgi:hypothetical protein
MNINALHILQHPLLAAKAKKEAEEKRLAEKAEKRKQKEGRELSTADKHRKKIAPGHFEND